MKQESQIPFPSSKDGRRVIGFIGNCQTELLQRAFAKRVAANPVRSFYHFFDIAKAEREAAAEALAQCDDLLVQDVQNFEHYPLRDAIPGRANIIRFPFLSFAAPWPYDDFNGLRDKHARSQDDPSLHTVIYYDGALGKLRKLIADPEARFEAYRRLEVPGLVSPEKILDFETRRLEAMDARFDIRIGQFILDEFRQQQLFYTVNRPCGSLLLMLLGFLLKTLHIDLDHDDLERDAGEKPVPTFSHPALRLDLKALPELDELRAIQSPVHPRIAEVLGIVWAEAGRLYRLHDQERDWEASVRAYIARYS